MAPVPQLPSVSITFSPAWWYARYGISFGEEAWSDPIARTELDRTMRRLLHERFGDVGLGEHDPAAHPNVEAYGHRFVAAFWGCGIRYFRDQPPAAVVLPEAAERLAHCQVPPVNTSPVVRKALSDARQLRERYGSCDGGINWGGPLNNAVSVFGEDILRALAQDGEAGGRALAAMASALILLYERVTFVVNRQPVVWPQPSGGIGNCPVCMISPETYRRSVLPADEWYRAHFRDFSIHHCGAMHPYAEVYSRLRPCALDVGWLSDRRQVRERYPRTPLSLMLEASVLRGKSQPEIDALVHGMVEEAAPADLITHIWVAEAGTEISDETVRDFMTVMSRLQY